MASLFSLLLVFLLLLPFSLEAAAQPSFWYDGHRRVPLRSTPADDALSRRPASRDHFYQSGPGRPTRSNDGRLYVCYPQEWTAAQIKALEQRYQLQPAPGRGKDPAVRLYRQADAAQALTLANRIYEENEVDCAAPLWKKQLVPKILADVNDPLFPLQWHLHNTGQCTGEAGADIAALAAWSQSLGAGVTIAIVDDGMEIGHPDLSENLLPAGHADFLANDADPTAGMHGTAVAGIAAGRGFNHLGLAGVAPSASLLGLRILPEKGGFTDEADEAAALGYTAVPVDIYNSSWGPADGTDSAFDGPSPMVRAVMERQIREGRGGLGSIYVWSAGNGGHVDDSNLDGYANSRYAIAVTATNCLGKAASYAESGSNILISAPSGDIDFGMIATDRVGVNGYNTGKETGELFDRDYSNAFAGTSGAAPVVSGTVALMLSANSSLNWREVQQVLALSAERHDVAHPGWRPNGAGLWINEQYGYGRIDADRAVRLARSWQEPLAPEQALSYGRQVRRTVPDNDPRGLVDTITVNQALRVENVAVTVDIPNHGYWGDLSIYLTSPAGTRVRLVKDLYLSPAALDLGYRQWTLRDALHLGESSKGEWTIEVIDNYSDDTGTFVSWQLDIHGTLLPDRPDLLPRSCAAQSISRPDVAVPATLAMGVSRHGGAYREAATGTACEDYQLMAAVNTGMPVAEQLAVAYYEGPPGFAGWYALTGNGWQAWDAQLASLPGFDHPVGAVATLHAGRLAPGSYQILNGFRSRDGEIFACLDPLRITVDE